MRAIIIKRVTIIKEQSNYYERVIITITTKMLDSRKLLGY